MFLRIRKNRDDSTEDGCNSFSWHSCMSATDGPLSSSSQVHQSLKTIWRKPGSNHHCWVLGSASTAQDPHRVKGIRCCVPKKLLDVVDEWIWAWVIET